jgi:hypothetical protein
MTERHAVFFHQLCSFELFLDRSLDAFLAGVRLIAPNSLLISVILLGRLTDFHILLNFFFFCNAVLGVQNLERVVYVFSVDAMLLVKSLAALGRDLFDLSLTEVAFGILHEETKRNERQ